MVYEDEESDGSNGDESDLDDDECANFEDVSDENDGKSSKRKPTSVSDEPRDDDRKIKKRKLAHANDGVTETTDAESATVDQSETEWGM